MAIPVPDQCGDCGSRDLVKHCADSETCPWVQCRKCTKITGVAFGAARTITSLHPPTR